MVLAQADLEEDQEDGSSKAGRDQHYAENLSGQPAEEDAADAAGDDERGGRPECQDASTTGHGPKRYPWRRDRAPRGWPAEACRPGGTLPSQAPSKVGAI